MTDSTDFTSVSVYPETRELLKDYRDRHDFDTYDETIRYLLDEPPAPASGREIDPRKTD